MPLCPSCGSPLCSNCQGCHNDNCEQKAWSICRVIPELSQESQAAIDNYLRENGVNVEGGVYSHRPLSEYKRPQIEK